MTTHTTTDIDWADHDQIAADIGVPFEDWAHECHAISIAIVKHYRIGRVARGACYGVGGQHSWITLGDPYDGSATIIDPTLWSYVDEVDGIVVTTIDDSPYQHRPHGWSDLTIWKWGVPQGGDGEHIDLTPAVPLSPGATLFLDTCRSAIGNLDGRFWLSLVSHAPLAGWPAAEIVAAIDDTPSVAALIPVDILGMLTDRNPGGLYLPADESD